MRETENRATGPVEQPEGRPKAVVKTEDFEKAKVTSDGRRRNWLEANHAQKESEWTEPRRTPNGHHDIRAC